MPDAWRPVPAWGGGAGLEYPSEACVHAAYRRDRLERLARDPVEVAGDDGLPVPAEDERSRRRDEAQSAEAGFESAEPAWECLDEGFHAVAVGDPGRIERILRP